MRGFGATNDDGPDAAEIIRRRWLVAFHRQPLDPHPLDGFVLACSEELTLVQEVRDFVAGGYVVIRNRDVSRHRVSAAADSFTAIALRLRRIAPAPLPGLSIGSWHEALATANAQFPLLTVHREAKDRHVCFIGRVTDVTAKTFTLDRIDPDARWIGKRRYLLRDLTRLEFGGSYERTLALVDAHRQRARNRQRGASDSR